MKEFWWELLFGLLHLVAVFIILIIYLAVVELYLEPIEYFSVPVSDMGIIHYLLLIVFLAVFMVSLIVPVSLAALTWSKLSKNYLDENQRRNIFYKSYHTPRTGRESKIHVRYIEWILKNS